jgi:serine/threonine-protein kinase
MASLMLAITRDEPVPVTRYRRDVPAEMDPIIGWSLAKDVDGRFANVHAFAHALSPFTTSEGHLIIQRIGEITAAGKRRRQGAPSSPQAVSQAAAMDRDDPVTVDGNDLLDEDDDDPRTAYRPPDAPVVSPTYGAPPAAAAQAPEEGLDRTLFIAPGYAAPSPAAAPRPAAGGAFGAAPAPAQPPVWQPMSGGPALPSLGDPPGAATLAIPSPMALPPTPPVIPGPTPPHASGMGGPRIALATVQSSSIPHNFAQGTPKPQPKGAKAALAVVAGAVVLLSVVAVVVVLKGRPGDTPEAVVSAKVSASAAPSAAPAASAAPSAAPSAEPVASAEPAASSAPVATVQPASTGKVAAKTGDKPDKKAKPEPTPTPVVPAGGGDTGTLVAVAVGGTCAFSVNGASKGTTSTLKLSLKPGTYSVTCAPSTGSSKSKSVTVTSGGTAMAMFKL